MKSRAWARRVPVWGQVLAAAGVGVLAWMGYERFYAGPRAGLAEAIASARQSVDALEDALGDEPGLRRQLKEFAGTTLGATREQADARVRAALNQLAAAEGLTGVEVNTMSPAPMRNPVGEARVSSTLARRLREQVDFSIVRADLKGTGTLEQSMRAVATVSVQPWAHRVDNVSVRPMGGKEQDRYEVRVGVSTLLMPPGLAPTQPAEPGRVSPDESVREVWEGIVAKNVFREPAALAVSPPPPPPTGPPPAPPPPPYQDWKLTGVVERSAGLEVLMVNVKSGQGVTLVVGTGVEGAKLVSGGGESAVFEIGGKAYEVRNGQTLGDRKLVTASAR